MLYLYISQLQGNDVVYGGTDSHMCIDITPESLNLCKETECHGENQPRVCVVRENKHFYHHCGNLSASDKDSWLVATVFTS